MKAEPSIIQTKDARSLSPIIERVCLMHDKNQQKQQRAQNANHNIIVQYEKFKKNYEQRIKQKDIQIMKKISESRKTKIEFYKKQSVHVEKIIEKFKKEDRRRQLDKLEMIKKRNSSTHKRQHSQKSEICSLNKTQNIERSQPRLTSSSINIEEFYKNKYLRISEMCEQIRKKSIQKQEKAESNRKSMQQQNPIKEINNAKLKKKLKAEEEFVLKQSLLIKKSIDKIQKAQKRCEQGSLSGSKKIKQLRERSKKNMEEVKRRRYDLESKIHERLLAIEKNSGEKKKKITCNKENMMVNLIEKKKSRRLDKVDNTMKNYSCNKNKFDEKMSDMYRKDRQQWGFLTGINQFKNVLIERNVYENNALSLQK